MRSLARTGSKASPTLLPGSDPARFLLLLARHEAEVKL